MVEIASCIKRQWQWFLTLADWYLLKMMLLPAYHPFLLLLNSLGLKLATYYFLIQITDAVQRGTSAVRSIESMSCNPHLARITYHYHLFLGWFYTTGTYCDREHYLNRISSAVMTIIFSQHPNWDFGMLLTSLLFFLLFYFIFDQDQKGRTVLHHGLI